MKLISKHNDFYDSASQFGIDVTQVFVRENKKDNMLFIEEKFKKYVELTPCTRYNSKSPFDVDSFLIVFCGKVIPVYALSYTLIETVRTYWPEKVVKHFYNIDQIEGFLQKVYPGYFKDKWNSKSSNNDIYSYRNNAFTRENVLAVGKELSSLESLAIESSHHLKCAYFKLKRKNLYGKENGFPIEFYPVLKDIDFARYLDPFSTHQEISQFYFGVIGCVENGQIEISDKDKVVGKGFDKDYGFRTRPKK